MDGVKLFWSGGGNIIVYKVYQPFKLSRLPAMVFTPRQLGIITIKMMNPWLIINRAGCGIRPRGPLEL